MLQIGLGNIVLLLIGVLLLSWQLLSSDLKSQADGASVLGPPTLPAATVNRILAPTPMAGNGSVVEQAARQTNIDDAFALAVWYVETNQGAAGVGLGDHNPGGVRASQGYPTDAGGYTIYPSYAAAIQDWFRIVQQRYIARGLTTVYAIAGPYVGTSSSGLWAGKVVTLMNRYRGEAPPPTPTPDTLKGQIAASLKGNAPQQTTQVELQEGGSSTGIPPNALPVRRSQATGSAAIAHWLVLPALIAALLLALAALWLRRRSEQSARTLQATPGLLAGSDQQLEPLPSLSGQAAVTEQLASPLGVASQAAPGGPAWGERHTDPLRFFPALPDERESSPEHAPLSRPRVVPAVRQLTAAAPRTRSLIRPPQLQPVAPDQSWQPVETPAPADEGWTPALPLPPAVAGGGLLSRYGRTH
jgi:hypothetical protein